MQKPTIHLNGTSAESLLEQYRNASGALQKALQALQEADPHGRDYYPQGEKAWFVANEEQRERLFKLRQMKEEMDSLAEYVAEYVK